MFYELRSWGRRRGQIILDFGAAHDFVFNRWVDGAARDWLTSPHQPRLLRYAQVRPTIDIPAKTDVDWSGHRFTLTSAISRRSNLLASPSLASSSRSFRSERGHRATTSWGETRGAGSTPKSLQYASHFRSNGSVSDSQRCEICVLCCLVGVVFVVVRRPLILWLLFLFVFAWCFRVLSVQGAAWLFVFLVVIAVFLKVWNGGLSRTHYYTKVRPVNIGRVGIAKIEIDVRGVRRAYIGVHSRFLA